MCACAVRSERDADAHIGPCVCVKQPAQPWAPQTGSAGNILGEFRHKPHRGTAAVRGVCLREASSGYGGKGFGAGAAKAEAFLASGQEDTGGGEGAGSAGSAGVSTLQEPQQLCAGVPCGAEQEEGALWRQ